MDTASSQHIPSFNSARLACLLGGMHAPLLVDVRKAPAYDADRRLIAGAIRLPPDDIQRAAPALPHNRAIIAYCVHGHEVSQNAARALKAAGLDAAYLEGGIADWLEAGLPTMAKAPELGLPTAPGKPTRWITRERPKIDRIACPWLIRRFVDPTAEFLYVPAGDVPMAARREHAIPYDVPDVLITHRGPEGELCSFDALIAECGLDDPCLQDLAAIVRGADTGKPELTPQSAGLVAHRAGSVQQHRPHHHRGDGRGVRRHAVAAHQQFR